MMIVEDAEHYIHLDQHSLMLDAIREVVDAARH
jgi:hypothetical protein